MTQQEMVFDSPVQKVKICDFNGFRTIEDMLVGFYKEFYRSLNRAEIHVDRSIYSNLLANVTTNSPNSFTYYSPYCPVIIKAIDTDNLPVKPEYVLFKLIY